MVRPCINDCGRRGESLPSRALPPQPRCASKRAISLRLRTSMASIRCPSIPPGKLRQFTVTADVNSAADGTATIPIYPPIIGPATPANPRQTVSVLPTAAAPLTFIMTANTAYYQNIVHQAGVRHGHVPLQEPFSGQSAYAVDNDTGVAIRTWKASDISTDLHASRADEAFGIVATRPLWACRVVSAVV